MIDLAKTQADCDARHERVEAMQRAVIDTVHEMTAAITLRSPQARTRLGDERGEK